MAPSWRYYSSRATNGDLAYLASVGGGPVFRIDRSDGGTTGDLFAYPEIAAGYRGGLSGVWGSDGNLYILPGADGGPHLRAFDRYGNLIRNEMVGDPHRRSGFAPVLVNFDREIYPPPLSSGAGYSVRLAFEGRRSSAYVRSVFDELTRLLGPLGFRLTTDRPALAVSAYGQVVFDSPTMVPNVLGFWPGPRWDAPVAAQYEARCVYITSIANPQTAASVAAHEVGHAFGLSHRSDGTVMSESRYLPYRFHPDDSAVLRYRTLSSLSVR